METFICICKWDSLISPYFGCTSIIASCNICPECIYFIDKNDGSAGTNTQKIEYYSVYITLRFITDSYVMSSILYDHSLYRQESNLRLEYLTRTPVAWNVKRYPKISESVVI